MYGILIGVPKSSLEQFCDEVASIQNLKEQGALQILRHLH